MDVGGIMNIDGGSYNSLNVIKDILWKALKRSSGIRSKVSTVNEFVIDNGTLEKLGDRTVIFNNQINRVDIDMHQDIYNAIEKIDQLEFKVLKQEASIDIFIESAYLLGITLPELIKLIEVKYLKRAMEDCNSKTKAAKRIGMSRKNFANKVKRFEIAMDSEEVEQ